MGKFYGKIGYAETKRTKPGVYEEVITERYYYGDINRSTRKLENSGGVNDNINIANEISIVADPYAPKSILGMIIATTAVTICCAKAETTLALNDILLCSSANFRRQFQDLRSAIPLLFYGA